MVPDQREEEKCYNGVQTELKFIIQNFANPLLSHFTFTPFPQCYGKGRFENKMYKNYLVVFKKKRDERINQI